MEVELKNGKIIITADADTTNPRVSASGKTRLVASDRDKGTVEVDGKPLTVQLNAYVQV